MNATLALSIVRSKWTYFGLMALVIVALLLRGNYHEARADNCEIARANDRKAFELASREAEAKAIAQKQAVEASYRAKAQEADNDYQIALARAQRASDVYAGRMRAKGLGGTSSGPASPAPRDGPEGPDRSSADAVILSRSDFDVMVENSVRLKAAHDWAKTLNAGAIPEVEFGR